MVLDGTETTVDDLVFFGVGDPTFSPKLDKAVVKEGQTAFQAAVVDRDDAAAARGPTSAAGCGDDPRPGDDRCHRAQAAAAPGQPPTS